MFSSRFDPDESVATKRRIKRFASRFMGPFVAGTSYNYSIIPYNVGSKFLEFQVECREIASQT